MGYGNLLKILGTKMMASILLQINLANESVVITCGPNIIHLKLIGCHYSV